MSAEPSHHGRRGLRHKRLVVDLLALVHIGDVEFNLRAIKHLERIENCHGREGVAGRIDDDPGRLLAGRMDGLDNLALEVGLADVNGQAEFLGVGFAPGTNVIQCGRAVDLRLSLAEKIQIWPI